MDAKGDSHLLGQHTIRMSPISTAKFNPSFDTFCLQSPSIPVFIPILLNNTSPVGLAYTITPLGQVAGEGKSERVVVSAKDLKAMEQSHHQLVTQSVKHSSAAAEPTNQPVVYEYDDDDDEADTRHAGSRSSLQKTQSIMYLRVTKPGTIQLERVRDGSNVDARISPFPARLTVARCPSAEFAYEAKADKGQDVRCAGKERDVEMAIDVKGVPPLSLRWYKSLNGRRESFLVEGIEGDEPAEAGPSAVRISGFVQQDQTVRVQLSASLNALGKHVYVLEEVVDALGNVVRLDSLYSSHMDRSSWDQVQTDTTRSLSVLPRPAVSFRSCGPNKPVPMKIGKSVPLSLAISAADELDSPWEVAIEHTPEDIAKAKDGWKKTFTSTEARQLTIDAEAPGSYSIVGVRGRVRLLSLDCQYSASCLWSCPSTSSAKETYWRQKHAQYLSSHCPLPRYPGRDFMNGEPLSYVSSSRLSKRIIALGTSVSPPPSSYTEPHPSSCTTPNAKTTADPKTSRQRPSPPSVARCFSSQNKAANMSTRSLMSAMPIIGRSSSRTETIVLSKSSIHLPQRDLLARADRTARRGFRAVRGMWWMWMSSYL